MSDVFKYLLKYEQKWCDMMGYFNPYVDPFTTHLTDKMPFFDKPCYHRYPRHNFVYDKLWIVKSQGLAGGRLEKLKGKEDKVSYPIFIKPRWGHLSASSKNCFKINSAEELKKYIDYKNMMCSEFYKETELMTDYVLLDGRIVHQMTSVYSDKQNGFSDDWKYVSPESKALPNVTDWVNQHMKEFTGIVNVQCRGDKIIEVSLRLSRGGAYLLSTENDALIQNINDIFNTKTWKHGLTDEMKFKPFYVYKCFTTLPIVYLFPQKIIDSFITKHTKHPFYEYYFEPTGSSGMVFFQFIDDDFERGMQTKLKIEKIFNYTQMITYVLLFIMVLVLFTQWKYKYIVALTILVLWLTRVFNPIIANYKLYKGQKQSLFKEGPTKDTEEDIEPFDMP